jgi:hypothetical protein
METINTWLDRGNLPNSGTGNSYTSTKQSYECVQTVESCNYGCVLDQKCYPFGYRKNGQYCSDSSVFVNEVKSESVCENNFECSTNLCIDNKCISSSLWKKIMTFFGHLFNNSNPQTNHERNKTQNETNHNNEVSISAKCLGTEVLATKVTNNSITYTVVLKRVSGNDTIGGIKLVFTNAGESVSVVRDVPGNIVPLASKQYSTDITPAELPNPNKVSVVVYYLDDSGVQQICQTAPELRFA